jgi:D-alanyl-D-alanine carboxypeptidase/D-alanyl-D-alanine-endopeptidase (penicillin-binding protein 4)
LTLQPGDPAKLILDPPVEYFLFDNRVTEGSPGRLEVERAGGSRQVRLTGQLDPQGTGVSTRLAVDDPAEFAAAALRDALLRRGIRVDGRAVARHWWPGRPAPPAVAGVELASRESPPLLETLKILNKVSQNLHAELMLCAVAHAAGRAGTREGGRAELETFLAEAGVPTSSVALADGSGLSRRNLVTPAAVHALLRYWHASPLRDAWMDLLPVGGEDGTLRARFRGAAAQGRVRAKTGTLWRVAALSGYLDRPDGSRWIFSILANFQPGAPAGLIDKIVVTLLD